jgi:DNA-binding NarL/FixJ family response regulator
MISVPATEPPPIGILVVESDPVIQSGLSTCLNRFSDLQIVAQAESADAALARLASRIDADRGIDLVLLGLPLDRGVAVINFCQQVKSSHPHLPIVAIVPLGDPHIQTLYQMGIAGCCVRGGSILDLVECLRGVAAGSRIWALAVLQQLPSTIVDEDLPLQGQTRSRSSSLEQIVAAIAELQSKLNYPQISTLDRLLIAGRIRELNAARWLVERLFKTDATAMLEPRMMPIDRLPASSSQLVATNPTGIIAPTALPDRLFDRIAAKLQFDLTNLTAVPLEIDLLRLEKKRELFYAILRQIEAMLDELRFSQITQEQLAIKQSIVLQDLWVAVITIFFGRYQTIVVGDVRVEIIPLLLENRDIVSREILDRIPYPIDLWNYLLFRSPLTIDNAVYAAGTQLAEDRACQLLENITISIANAVMQPLLDRFANVDEIKYGFFDRRLLSTREIERFRNDLSWRYRIDRYIKEPQAIFESQHQLFVFTNHGIDRINIYAHRPQELAQLGGIPLAVTLALETRDAISPRLKSATAFFGSALVYILTEIIGRGIGLIGRGIIKGVGNIWQETNRLR